MNCAEFKELAAVYALGALDPAQRAEADAHLAEPNHEGCFEELRTAMRGAEALAWSSPPARLDPRVWRGIADRVSPRRIGWRAAAAAALALVLFGTWGGLRNRSELTAVAREKQACLRDLDAARDEGDRQRAAIALVQSPGSRIVNIAAKGKPPLARALVDAASGRAMILATSFAQRPDRDYQLWVIHGQEPPRPGILLRGDALASIDPGLLAGGVDALAISIEPRGGSPNGKPSEVLGVGLVPKS